MKTAFIYPGQGAQYCGMGQDFYENFPTAARIYDLASEVTGYDMKALCFSENEQLHQTEYTQPAMVATELALTAVLREQKGIQADVCAGLSLGEYAALYAAGVMSVEDALRAVTERGKLMASAVPSGEGAMAAVLMLPAETIEQVLSGMDGVWIANYNCSGQIVITGKKDAVEAACVRLKEAGAKRCVPLKVSGPFHSPLLKEAGAKLGAVLAGCEIHAPKLPYYANVTAEPVTTAEAVVPLLVEQVASSVRWQQSIEAMLAAGVTDFYEIGPGKTLAGFMKKITKDPSVTVRNIDKTADLDF